MNERIVLSEVLASRPIIRNVDENFYVNLNDCVFDPGYVDRYSIENYSGLNRIVLISKNNTKICTFAMFEKSICSIESITENNETTLLFTIK